MFNKPFLRYLTILSTQGIWFLIKSNSTTRLKNIDTFSKRNKLDIITSILKKAKQGETKTHLMYSCNLNYRQFKKYVILLLDIGFLEIHSFKCKNKQTLKTTSKGLKFLIKYIELKTLLNLDFPVY